MRREEFTNIYYGSPVVRDFIHRQFEDADYCVASGPALTELGWSKEFPVHVIPLNNNPHCINFNHQIHSIDQMMDLGLDIFRPIREMNDDVYYITWDLEYYNRTDPYWLYHNYGENQRQIFRWMEPALECLTDILNEYGIKYTVDITASGIHVWSAITTDSACFYEFVREGYLEDSLMDKYSVASHNDLKRYKPVPAELGLAYSTAGKVLEFLTHILIERSNHLPLPITIADTAQGGDSFHDSGISSDLTQYAHPIYMRVLRVMGSTHLKVTKVYPDSIPAVDILKVPGMSYMDALEIMWDPYAAIDFYRDKSPDIPVSNNGWMNALIDYRKSEICGWHREFESDLTDSYKYRMLDHPPCIQSNIYFNATKDALLTPSNLQLIAEYMDKAGESLSLIASGIANKYHDPNYGWFDPVSHSGIDWNKYDPSQAANFWMRVYMALGRAGYGRGLDCEKVQKSTLCPVRMCGINLRDHL